MNRILSRFRPRGLLGPGFALMLALQGPVPALAAEVAGLYQATVNVASRDSERERIAGFGVAMRQMLIKLTGRTDTLDNPAIGRALSAPQSYVDRWGYRSTPAAAPAQGEQIVMEVTFFEASIQELLNSAGIAVWPQNRPETLLWIAIQDELGERYLAGTEAGSGSDVVDGLRAAAAERGLPLRMPLMDFEDQRALRPDQVWNAEVEALRAASARYMGESVLVLRIFRSLRGDVIAKATYMFRERVLEFDVLEGSLEEFLNGSVKLAAEELAGYYAILLSGAGAVGGTEVLMTVDGVDSLEDYAGLLSYLQGLAAVNTVQLRSVQNGSLELELSTGGQFRQLIESIALDRRMAAVAEVSRAGQQVLMHYQWQAR